MRTLELNQDWGAWKFGDTDAVMTFSARTDGKAPSVNNKTLTFEIAKGNATVRQDYIASAPGESDDDGSTVALHTSDLTMLKPGTYSVELWITDNDTKKTSVYPSDGFCSFTIDENTMAVTDVANIKTMTLEAVYSDLLQKIDAFKSGKPGKDGATPKLIPGKVTKLPANAQPGFLLTPTASDPNTYVLDLNLPQGIQGPQGASVKGPQGAQGNDGLTPNIGDNGNWFLGATDTGVHAQGPKGDMPDVSNFITSATLAQNVTVINAAIAKRVTKEDFDNLQTKVDNNVQNTTKNAGDISNLETTVEDHDKAIKQLQQQLSNQNDAIKKLQESVSKLTAKPNSNSAIASNVDSGLAKPATSEAKPVNSGTAGASASISSSTSTSGSLSTHGSLSMPNSSK
ncbi:hypothetical protein [Limosilactobacillus kribbianus]|uniref:hypothetical protein n=1 Tax=Limosilactobacillus kribbianus TaxID=2982695 RepID=UPI0022653FA6|nr:hypothetical protein [Limosilactobacillus kribbianus]